MTQFEELDPLYRRNFLSSGRGSPPTSCIRPTIHLTPEMAADLASYHERVVARFPAHLRGQVTRAFIVRCLIDRGLEAEGVSHQSPRGGG